MIWLVWRRQRAALLTVAGLVAVVAVVLVAGRIAFLAHMRAHGVDETCFDVLSEACRRDAAAALDVDQPSGYGMFWSLGHFALLALPLVVGLLAGVELFHREIDERTYVLALTQGVTPARWWATNLLVTGVPVAVLPVLLGVVAGWAYAPFDLITYSFSPLETPIFEISGIVPAAYALLAFALAAGTGLVAGGRLTAAIVAVVGYAVLMFVLATIARPDYLPAEIVRQSIDPTRPDGGLTDVAGTWQIERHWVDDQGVQRHTTACGQADEYLRCLHDAGVTGYAVRTQPDLRYWAFQLIETAILVALSAVVLASTHPRVAARWRDRRVTAPKRTTGPASMIQQ
ncbi:hypothetical protein ACQPZQ_39625 [Pseudonocardia sp. CA-142604]|uniref:hypothetical protein n=1 Tax=Pseudonocardia sp. CA-142604 TaxID=3240024 RepID=UPI003D8D334E